MKPWTWIALALMTIASTGCGEDRLETGCEADAQCREGRICDMTTARCIWVDPGDRPETSEPIDVSDLVDVPDEVSEPPASDERDLEDFLGTWALADAATAVFSVATVPALSGCEAEAQVRGAGLVFRGGPCRAEGNRLETFGGVAYFDEFGELTVDLSGIAEQLATGFDETFTYTASGLEATENEDSDTPLSDAPGRTVTANALQ